MQPIDVILLFSDRGYCNFLSHDNVHKVIFLDVIIQKYYDTSKNMT